MGIDAEILLRVKGEKPTDQQIARWGDALCRSIGAQHFFISDGLPSTEYHAADKAWHKAFNAHPLYAEWSTANKADRWPKFDSDALNRQREVRDKILADVGQRPEQLRRAIELTHTRYPLDDDDTDVPPEYREPGKCWIQDGDPIFAERGEWFLEVNVWTRYYGIGYERGDLMTLCAIAEWCEVNIPGVEVWYGGDSSGVVAQPWPDSERRKLRRHLYSEQGRAYFAHDWFGGEHNPKPKPCGLCVDGGKFAQTGAGGNWMQVHCASCGKNFESSDGGSNWTVKEKE